MNVFQLFKLLVSNVCLCFCLHQDLKEKKLVEEKENGKDAATNGKVTAASSPIALTFHVFIHAKKHF